MSALGRVRHVLREAHNRKKGPKGDPNFSFGRFLFFFSFSLPGLSGKQPLVRRERYGSWRKPEKEKGKPSRRERWLEKAQKVSRLGKKKWGTIT